MRPASDMRGTVSRALAAAAAAPSSAFATEHTDLNQLRLKRRRPDL
jgi:hypothetical protein